MSHQPLGRSSWESCITDIKDEQLKRYKDYSYAVLYKNSQGYVIDYINYVHLLSRALKVVIVLMVLMSLGRVFQSCAPQKQKDFLKKSVVGLGSTNFSPLLVFLCSPQLSDRD